MTDLVVEQIGDDIDLDTGWLFILKIFNIKINSVIFRKGVCFKILEKEQNSGMVVP